MVDTASKTGFISQIIGPVVDIEFPTGDLPKSLQCTSNWRRRFSAVTCEVQQLLR